MQRSWLIRGEVEDVWRAVLAIVPELRRAAADDGGIMVTVSPEMHRVTYLFSWKDAGGHPINLSLNGGFWLSPGIGGHTLLIAQESETPEAAAAGKGDRGFTLGIAQVLLAYLGSVGAVIVRAQTEATPAEVEERKEGGPRIDARKEGGPRIDAREGTKKLHKLLRDPEMAVTRAEELAHSDIDTYRKWCKLVTGEEPLR